MNSILASTSTEWLFVNRACCWEELDELIMWQTRYAVSVEPPFVYWSDVHQSPICLGGLVSHSLVVPPIWSRLSSIWTSIPWWSAFWSSFAVFEPNGLDVDYDWSVVERYSRQTPLCIPAAVRNACPNPESILDSKRIRLLPVFPCVLHSFELFSFCGAVKQPSARGCCIDFDVLLLLKMCTNLVKTPFSTFEEHSARLKSIQHV